MILSGFGHRPDEVGGYDADTLARLTLFAIETIPQYGPTKILTGMGLGWEQALALAAIELEVPFAAILPFTGQEKMWPERTQAFYHSLLEKAASVRTLSVGGFKGMKYVERDKWIIDRSDCVAMLWKNWDSSENFQESDDMTVVQDMTFINILKVKNTDGSMRRIKEYADEKEKPIHQLWSKWLEWGTEVNFEDFRDMLMGMCADEG